MFTFINATNEGDAVALACGAVMAGKRSVVMFQNSGLGNALNPLTSLNYTFKIPLLLIIALRGDPHNKIQPSSGLYTLFSSLFFPLSVLIL